ncbi:MAG: fluoride efflux transporter FluC [Acidimicrobiales bacterium]
MVVALGGMAGAACRYGLGTLISTTPGDVPWDTFVENVAGAFLLGVVLSALVRRFPGSRYLRPFLAVGFLGSFTTFSALAVEADQLIRDGQAVLAAGYWVLSLVAGLSAAWVGIVLARSVLTAAGEHDR